MFTTAPDRQTLLSIARQTLSSVCAGGALPTFDAAQMPPALTTHRACFVTLTLDGRLRGCIGTVLATEPLYLSVAHNACGAAKRDPRFDPVVEEEVGAIRIEISVLTEPEPLQWSSPDDVLRALRPGVDGVLLRRDLRLATFLPQVWEHVPEKERFMALLCEKAGFDPSAWRTPGTAILTYQVESFFDMN